MQIVQNALILNSGFALYISDVFILHTCPFIGNSEKILCFSDPIHVSAKSIPFSIKCADGLKAQIGI